MTDKPIPIDLVPFAEMLDGGREFLRAWAKEGGPASYFVNPKALGADPALFGIALVDAARHAAAAWGKALGHSQDEMLARIWEGFDAERTAPTNDLPLPVAVARKDD
ncbi:DUF5076 domain-containing protein [Sphingomonas panacisoli]|uniref:DUF5076 domain-containing protein n=1 Tax=Sphingomonas panacisoli TaxID=1813879 RepID=A0A5B8LHN6_9SPHN|nr:DUF5076 domain-containing protein [Sphingomonas panacisoli]QDZ07817.1 DUF5076 domain-containing protein [Sphingomonas panacisoli]